MGILLSKKVKQKEKHPFNKDIKNGTTEEAAASQGLGPTQLINHQMEPSNGNEAMPTKVDQVPAVERQDLSEKLKQPQSSPAAQVLQKTKPTSPMQQQTDIQKMCGHTQPEETRNFTPSQQNLTAKKTSECDKGMRTTADSVHSSEISPSVRVPTQMLCKDTLPQVECRSWSKEQQEMSTQIPHSKMQAAVPYMCKEVVRGVPTENLHSKDAETQMKAKITKSPHQKSNCVPSNVYKANTDWSHHATEKAHDIAQQNTTAESGLAKEHVTEPKEPLDHSTQMSNLPNAPVNNKENELHTHCLHQDSVTNLSVVYQYWVMDKSERGRANAAKIRLRQKLAKQLKAPPGEGSRGSQQTTEETVTIVPESSQQQVCTDLEETPVKNHNDRHLIPQPTKADNGNTSHGMQKVNMKAVAQHVPVVEKKPTAAATDGATHKPRTDADSNVKLRLQCELNVSKPQDSGAVTPKKKCTARALNQNQPKNNTGNVMIPPVTPEQKGCGEGRWPQFTVNPSCSSKARCQHNPGTGLPPNVQKWIDDCPNKK